MREVMRRADDLKPGGFKLTPDAGRRYTTSTDLTPHVAPLRDWILESLLSRGLKRGSPAGSMPSSLLHHRRIYPELRGWGHR